MRKLSRWAVALWITCLPLWGYAASAVELDAKARGVLTQLYQESPAAKELAGKARGMLVFPEIVKGGVALGAEYGEGVLLVEQRPLAYYNTIGASFGWQLGLQIRSQVLLFMTDQALADFRHAEGWKVGVDGSVALATLGAAGSIDTETAKSPIIGFVFNNKGLMVNISLEGSKFTRIER